MQHFFLNTIQQIPLQEVLTGVRGASTSGVNTLELRERLQQIKRPLASSNKSLQRMWAREQKITKDSEEEEEEEKPLMIKRWK
jgi:hypothetical protein